MPGCWTARGNFVMMKLLEKRRKTMTFGEKLQDIRKKAGMS